MAFVKTDLDKTQALKVIYDFYQQFQQWIASGKAPALNEVEKYLANQFKITSNGQVVGKSSADYLARIKKFIEKYSRFEISKPLEEPLIAGNQITIYYRIDLTPKTGGSPKQVYILASGTIENNHIATWTQVTHEQGSNNWDK